MKPRLSYLVCANQRSGSSMLCAALGDTGVAGRPSEYFITGDPEAFPPGWKFWEEGPLAVEHGVRDRRAFLDLVSRVGSTANGVFGAKLMWNNVRWVVERFRELDEYAELSRADVFRRAFPNLHVVHLVRRDLLRQAVSWARAAQDEVWVVWDGERPASAAEPVYDPMLMGNLVGLLEEGEREWRLLYRELGVTPYEVAYEDLLDPDGYERNLRGILEHLGVAAPAVLPPLRTVRLGDALNDEWVARFTEERATRCSPGAVARSPGERRAPATWP
jgi:LPS sulfotransferase NodH